MDDTVEPIDDDIDQFLDKSTSISIASNDNNSENVSNMDLKSLSFSVKSKVEPKVELQADLNFFIMRTASGAIKLIDDGLIDKQSSHIGLFTQIVKNEPMKPIQFDDDVFEDDDERQKLESFYRREAFDSEEKSHKKKHRNSIQFNETVRQITTDKVEKLIEECDTSKKSSTKIRVPTPVPRLASIVSQRMTLRKLIEKNRKYEKYKNEAKILNENIDVEPAKPVESVKESIPKLSSVVSQRIKWGKLIEKSRKIERSANVSVDPTVEPKPKLASVVGQRMRFRKLAEKNHRSNNEDHAEEAVIERTKETATQSNKRFKTPSTGTNSTLSDYGLKFIMDSEYGFDEEVDVPDSVRSLLKKMVKSVSRRVYLHEIDALDASYNSDWELNYFKKDDHLYDLGALLTKTQDAYFDEFENGNESQTDVSCSVDNEYLSYLKLGDDKETPVPTQASRHGSAISSYCSLDEGLNLIIKEELKATSHTKPVIVSKPSFKLVSKKLSTARHLIFNEILPNTLLHDDFFLTEPVKESRGNQQKPETSNIDNQGNQNASTTVTTNTGNLKPSKKPVGPQTKKREARINLMKSAFGDKKKKPVQNEVEIRPKSILDKRVKDTANTLQAEYKKPTAKSNLKVRIIEQSTELPVLRQTKSAIPPSSSTIKTTPIPYVPRHFSELKKKAIDTGPIDERQKYPRPVSSKQPWGTITHPPYGLGFQKMTPYEIKQSVERLYYVPKEPKMPQRTVTSLSREDFCNMIHRLTHGSADKAADRCRTQAASIYRDIGILNSYAWNGNDVLTVNPRPKWDMMKIQDRMQNIRAD